jgi:hypothetical protein
MSEELKKILINEAELLQYLKEQLPPGDTHAFEKMMANDPFVDDAVEGLQQIKQTDKVPAYVEQLNRNLQQKIALNKKRKDKRRWKEQPWIYLVIATLLILIIISFVVIKKQLQSP